METQEINNTAVQETEKQPVETLTIQFSRKLARAIVEGESGSPTAFSYAAKYRCIPSTRSPAAHASAALLR